MVPFDAGGTVDAVARALADKLNDKWSVPVIVENRPGAGNTIGATAVAKAEPDGYTLLFANTSVSVNPSLFKTPALRHAARSCAGDLSVAVAQRAAGAETRSA